MATAIVSGRVDEAVKERAGAYIHAAGLTVGDVINKLWEYIAATGDTTEFLEKAQTEQLLHLNAFCSCVMSSRPSVEERGFRDEQR